MMWLIYSATLSVELLTFRHFEPHDPEPKSRMFPSLDENSNFGLRNSF